MSEGLTACPGRSLSPLLQPHPQHRRGAEDLYEGPGVTPHAMAHGGDALTRTYEVGARGLGSRRCWFLMRRFLSVSSAPTLLNTRNPSPVLTPDARGQGLHVSERQSTGTSRAAPPAHTPVRTESPREPSSV